MKQVYEEIREFFVSKVAEHMIVAGFGVKTKAATSVETVLLMVRDETQTVGEAALLWWWLSPVWDLARDGVSEA